MTRKILYIYTHIADESVYMYVYPVFAGRHVSHAELDSIGFDICRERGYNIECIYVSECFGARNFRSQLYTVVYRVVYLQTRRVFFFRVYRYTRCRETLAVNMGEFERALLFFTRGFSTQFLWVVSSDFAEKKCAVSWRVFGPTVYNETCI